MSSWKAELEYAKELVGAGVDGLAAARREFDGPVFGPVAAGSIWTPAAVCAGIGIIGGRFAGRKRTNSGIAAAGLAGVLVGSAMALAWTSRRFARHAAAKTVRSVNAVRDQHWLRAHPIDYA
jgi:hypothetical protein